MRQTFSSRSSTALSNAGQQNDETESALPSKVSAMVEQITTEMTTEAPIITAPATISDVIPSDDVDPVAKWWADLYAADPQRYFDEYLRWCNEHPEEEPVAREVVQQSFVTADEASSSIPQYSTEAFKMTHIRFADSDDENDAKDSVTTYTRCAQDPSTPSRYHTNHESRH
jgi:hypothetical protein